jgi:Caspase domain
MKLALLIGVTDYAAPIPKLPACKNDLSIVSRLIGLTKKFDDILEVGGDTSSATVKAQLAQFVKKHSGAEVEELFFYYTGHGDLFKDDFYFLFSDFSDKQRNQTSLTTQELDSMLRTLSPKLTIKVVDACHAGVTYVKEPDALKKQLTISTGRFGDCYFMFSSQSSQSSLQDDKLSDFTREFVHACTRFQGKEIRYRDIVDHISDAFETNPDQTPTFVIQAPCVEIFCAVDKSIRKLLGPAEPKSSATQSPSAPFASAIAQAIKARAEEFCTREEVESFLNSLGEHVRSAQFSADLTDSYRLEAELLQTYDGVPDLGPIGTWIKEKGAGFFAVPLYTTETYEMEDPIASIYLRPTVGGNKPVLQTRQVVSGFDCTATVPFKGIRITAHPLFENLPHAVGMVLFVFSKKDCVFFYAFQTVKELDWGKLAPIESRRWTYFTVTMKADLLAHAACQDLVRRFEQFLIKEVKERLGLEDEKTESSKSTNQKDESKPAAKSETKK